MPDNHHQSKLHEGDEELLQEEENEQEKVEDISDQDVAQMGAMVQGLGGFMMLRADRFNKFKNAYNTITDPKLAENLLDLNHPENLYEAQSAISVSRHELAKKSNISRGYTESHFLFWKSNRLTPDQLYRARYSTILAKQLHHRVNQTSSRYKIEGFINNFKGTDQENEALRKSLNKWIKDHPGESLDKAILAESKRIKKARGERFGRKEEEEIRSQLAAARSKAVDEHKAEAARTVDKIKYTLDPNNPSPATSQLRPDLQQIQTGQVTLAAPTTTPVTPAVPTTPIITPSSSTITPPIPLATRLPLSSPRLTLFSSLSARWSNFKDRMFSGFRANWSKFTGKISNFFKPLTDRLKNSLLGRFLGKGKSLISRGADLIMKGGKMLLNRGLDALLPGLGAAVGKLNDTIQKITGIDIEATLAWGLLLLIIGVPLLVILLVMNLGSSSNTIPNYGVQNSMKVSLKNPSQRFAWSDFENNFLSLKRGEEQTSSLSWEDFEKNNLRRSLP